VKTVGVVGFGVMGALIGLNVAMSGYRVVFKELNDDLVKSMYEKGILKPLSKQVAKGKMTQEVLGVRFGIMWVQNAAGLGTCFHAGNSMVEYLGDSDVGYPQVPESLKAKFEAGELWDIENGEVLADEAAGSQVKDRLLGAIFAISTHLIEKEVVSFKDLELGIKTSLAWPKGPFEMMNDLGMEEVTRLVKVAVAAGDFKLPRKFAVGDLTPWEL